MKSLNTFQVNSCRIIKFKDSLIQKSYIAQVRDIEIRLGFENKGKLHWQKVSIQNLTLRQCYYCEFMNLIVFMHNSFK